MVYKIRISYNDYHMSCNGDIQLHLAVKEDSSIYEKRLHMTKRIDVTIMQKEIIELKWHHCCYIYTFSGLDEYKGINFYDKSALVEKSHVVGERVSLLINEWNVEEFWFEEEVEPGKEIIVCSLILIFVTIIEVIIALDNWDSVPWF